MTITELVAAIVTEQAAYQEHSIARVDHGDISRILELTMELAKHVESLKEMLEDHVHYVHQ